MLDFTRLNKLIENKIGMQLTIFDSRYSDGYVALLSADEDISRDIVESFQGSDNSWASVRFYLGDLEWYPITFAETIHDALAQLIDKIQAIPEKDLPQWFINVDQVGRAAAAKSFPTIPSKWSMIVDNKESRPLSK